MIMILRRVTLALLVAATFSSVTADQPPPPDTHREAAMELLDVLHVERTVNDGIDLMLKAQLQANPSLRDFEDVMRTFLSKYMSWDAVRDDYARIYMSTFNEKEIKQLMEFYRTPLGQKLIGALPDIMKKGAELGQGKVADHLEELKALVEARAQELQKAKQAPRQDE